MFPSIVTSSIPCSHFRHSIILLSFTSSQAFLNHSLHFSHIVSNFSHSMASSVSMYSVGHFQTKVVYCVIANTLQWRCAKATHQNQVSSLRLHLYRHMQRKTNKHTEKRKHVEMVMMQADIGHECFQGSNITHLQPRPMDNWIHVGDRCSPVNAQPTRMLRGDGYTDSIC